MNWSILKKLNSNFKLPLNELLRVSFTNMRCEWFLENRTFKVPQDGWYIITCVGKGGNACGTKTGTASGAYGGGGGGGAVTKGKYYLKKGSTYAIKVGNPSSFGSLISANGGANGDVSTPGAGGTVAIAGNIFAYAGKAASSRTGGAAGLTNQWSTVQSGAGKGYFPIINNLHLGGKRGTDSTSPTSPYFGSGSGGAYKGSSVPGEAGAGGAAYGGGGQGGVGGERDGYTNRGITNGGGGAAGVVIVEYVLTITDL